MFRHRRHCFEFGDQRWFKGWLRDAYLDCLNHGLRAGGQFRNLHMVFSDWASRNGPGPVLDLGSGGGGPIATMLQYAAFQGVDLPQIYLSDLHPSMEHYRLLSEKFGPDRLSYEKRPLSALAPSPTNYPLRSICSTLHHFRPEDVRQIVQQALKDGRSLLIVEPLQRDFRHFLLVLLSGPFAYMLAPFTASRWSWKKFFVTLPIPLVPLLVMWDGLVSTMRMYRPDEIAEMIPQSVKAKIKVTTLPYLGIFRASCIEISRTS